MHNPSTSNQQSSEILVGKYARKTPDVGEHFRKNITKYCWTHRACIHSSKDCSDKAEGYQNIATFDSKIEHSKVRCE